jgi:hypothetical protein
MTGLGFSFLKRDARPGVAGGGPESRDLITRLQTDPAWLSARRERSQLLTGVQLPLSDSEKQLVADLRRCGVRVKSVWDLQSSPEPYPQAIPILLTHLQHPYVDRLREGIARALAVRDSRSVWDLLVQLYREEPADSGTKTALALAVATAADSDQLDELITLAKDPENGASRTMLLGKLRRSDDPAARAALDDLASDPQLELRG